MELFRRRKLIGRNSAYRPTGLASLLHWRQRKSSTTRVVAELLCSPSGRRDSNPRPPEPHSGALPGCATSRQQINVSFRPPDAAETASPQFGRGGAAADRLSAAKEVNPIQVRYRAALRPVQAVRRKPSAVRHLSSFPSNATGLRGACPERSEGSRNFVPLIAKPLTADPIFNLKSSIFNRPNPHLYNGPVS